jgi:hypothetical protein
VPPYALFIGAVLLCLLWSWTVKKAAKKIAANHWPRATIKLTATAKRQFVVELRRTNGDYQLWRSDSHGNDFEVSVAVRSLSRSTITVYFWSPERKAQLVTLHRFPNTLSGEIELVLNHQDGSISLAGEVPLERMEIE